MWEYVKGSDGDFQGAPEWATHLVFCSATTPPKDGDRAWANGEVKGCRWESVADGDVSDLIHTPEQCHVVAERRKVDSLQSRVNDANLWQGVNNAERIRRETWSAVSGEPLNTESLIAERGTRYGEFKDGAAIMQQLKDVMKSTPKWGALKPSQKESLEMIQHKIGRILNGDPDYDDNWKDIAGYATLIAKELIK